MSQFGRLLPFLFCAKLLATTTSAFSATSHHSMSTRPTGVQSTKTALAMGLTLYGYPSTRSPLCNWAANELGVALEAGDVSQNPHPFKQMPCLTDDNDVVVFESGAILVYLIQNYAPASLSQADKAAIISWIVWANASLDSICFLETPDGKVYDTGLRNPTNKRLVRLNELLSNQDCLVPSAGFSAADVAVASYLLYVLQFFPDVDVSPYPAIKDYVKRSASRQAYGDAFGTAVQAKLVDALSEGPPKKLFGVF